jgi:hypothetical protein
MPSKKSQIALQFSIENFPVELYLWTFTWADPTPAKEGVKKWRNFLQGKGQNSQGFRSCFPTASGIRVFEIHPGGDRFQPGLSHGLHVHAIIDKRLPVDIMRTIWKEQGEGGMINVRRVPRDRAIYVGKYLSKQRNECMKGVRLWAAFGECETSKVKDIVVDGKWTATYRFLACAIKGFDKLRYDQRARIVSHFCLGEHIDDALRSIGMEPMVTEGELEAEGEAWKHSAQE